MSNERMLRDAPSPSPPPPDPPFSLRIDMSAHHAARLCAHAEGVTVTDVLIRALRAGLTEDDKRHG